MVWLREGYCCQCGQCCVGNPFEGHQDQPREPVVEGYCPFYEVHNRLGFCTTHTGIVPLGQEHPYYLNNCSVWPSTPDEIADKPSCTYTFRWVEDGN